MVQRSYNGLPVLEEAPPVHIVPHIEPVVKLRLRPGTVATILLECARRWHNEVEPLDMPGPPDEWGWANRLVRDSDTRISNHASGSAEDLNATRHPRGVPTADTLTPAQVARCRAIRASMHDEEYGGPVVRWGGDYKTSQPDAMHWEIADDVPASALERVALRILAKWEEIAAETAAETEIDMFLASVPGTADDRVFLVGIDGKRLVPNPQVLAELKKLGIPDKGDVSAQTLNVFPTVDSREAREQSAWAGDVSRDTELATKVDKLTEMVGQLLEGGSTK